MKASKNPHSRFYGLIAQLPHANKEDLIWEYSHTVTTSLSEFYQRMPKDYARMINDLQKMVDSMKERKKPEENTAELKRLRSAILHRLQKHGVDTTDWTKVNAFMSQPRIVGKTLGRMSIEEMKALIPKLENILKKDKVKQAELNQLTLCN